MTVQVGRNDIKLGWETGAAIVLFLVTTMFGAGMYAAKFLAKQDEIYTKQAEIYSFVKTLAKHDSSATAGLIRVNLRVDSLNDSNAPVMAYNRPKKKGHYYIERRINGRLQVIEVDNPNNIQ